jgi:hypothetical protein
MTISHSLIRHSFGFRHLDFVISVIRVFISAFPHRVLGKRDRPVTDPSVDRVL